MHPLICMWIIAAGVSLCGGAPAYAGMCLAFSGVIGSAIWWQDTAHAAALTKAQAAKDASHDQD